MVAGQQKLHIVFFGPYDEHHHARLRVIHEGLTAAGHEVVECNAPGRPVLTGLQLVRRSRAIKRADVVVVGRPGALGTLLARLRWPRCRIVLERGRPVPRTDRIARLADRRADLVLVERDDQVDQLPDRHKAVVVPVGAPTAWFAAGDRRRAHLRPERATGPMRVVFLAGGAADEQVTLVGRTIDRLAEHYIEWTIVGPPPLRPAIEASTHGRGKVNWHHQLSADALSDLVADHDVCLGPFTADLDGQDAATEGVLQGAAAGCAIVSGATAVLREALGETAVFVPPTDVDSLAAVLAGLAADPLELGRLREATTLRALEALTPASVTKALVTRLADTPVVPF